MATICKGSKGSVAKGKGASSSKAKKRPRVKHSYLGSSGKPEHALERVSSEDIILKQGKGGKKTGGMPGGLFWHIYHLGVRAGKVFINYDNDAKTANIQVFLNKKSQGKGIGRIAYRMACEESNYSEVYASMRKDNTASIRAATAASFHQVPSKNGQITMLWKRNGISN